MTQNTAAAGEWKIRSQIQLIENGEQRKNKVESKDCSNYLQDSIRTALRDNVINLGRVSVKSIRLLFQQKDIYSLKVSTHGDRSVFLVHLFYFSWGFFTYIF